MKYVYPKLPAVYTNPYFRVGGNGLANCLFVYGKAIVEAHKHNATIIAPTWFNISVGPYLRRQKDKRHYLGQLTSENEINGLKRLFFLLTGKRHSNNNDFDSGVLVVEGIYDFFKPLLAYQNVVRDYILKHINPSILREVNHYNFKNCIAAHVRLGDFPESRRVPISWYLTQIKKHGNGKHVLLFSDGKNEELQQLMELPNVKRVQFGGAMQDIVAISRCEYVIGSDSSFSAWGAFLGQVPCAFYRLQFGKVLLDESQQFVEC